MLTFTIFSSERASDSLTDTESEGKNGSSSDDHGAGVRGPDGKHNNHGEITGMIPFQFYCGSFHQLSFVLVKLS